VRDALAALPGVRHVKIDFEKKQAVVTVDESALDEGKLVDALEDAGFGGSVLKQGSATVAGNEADLPPRPGLPAGDAEAANGTTTSSASGAFGKRVTVSAHLDRDALRPGDSFRVAVVIDIKDGWHIYGNPLGPGIGKPTVVSVAASEGFHFDSTRYAPAHKATQDFGEAGKTWVWEISGRSFHYLTGRVGENVATGKIEPNITVSGQVCNPISCLPGSVSVPLVVLIVPQDSPTEAINSGLFSGFDRAKPAPEDASD
jgi:copper chaperone CopZ/DsbC/DsbD-like thiol-disulfide interchange protein